MDGQALVISGGGVDSMLAIRPYSPTGGFPDRDRYRKLSRRDWRVGRHAGAHFDQRNRSSAVGSQSDKQALDLSGSTLTAASQTISRDLTLAAKRLRGRLRNQQQIKTHRGMFCINPVKFGFARDAPRAV